MRRELAGDLHRLRVEELVDRLRVSALPAELVRRQRFGDRLTFVVDGRLRLEWWSYWRHDIQVSAMRHLSWVDEIGWVGLFDPCAGGVPAERAVVIRDDSGSRIRLLAHRVEIHPLVSARHGDVVDRASGPRR